MAFPDLTLVEGRTNLSIGTGTPDDGINEFAHNWALADFQINPNLIEIEYQAQGPSVSGAEFVGLSDDKMRLRINFTQNGTDQVKVIAHLQHSASA